QIGRRELGKRLIVLRGPFHRSGRAVTAPEQVGGHDRMPGGVQRLAGPDEGSPPGLGIRTAGERVEHEDPAVLARGLRVADYAIAKPQAVERLPARGDELAQRELPGGRTVAYHGRHPATPAAAAS